MADSNVFSDPFGVTSAAIAAALANGPAVNLIIGASNKFGWTGRSSLSSPADGKITLLNTAGTTFDVLQFGGTTSSFPALRVSGTGLAARLADNSNDTFVTALFFKANNASLSNTSGSVLAAGNGTNGDFSGQFYATYLRCAAKTVSTLTAAATIGAGAIAYVTDATATTRLSVAAGGGSNKVMVWSDGTNWLIF